MKNTTILVHLEGGLIQWIASDNENVSVIITDNDIYETEGVEHAVDVLAPDIIIPAGSKFSDIVFSDAGEGNKAFRDELKERGF